MHRPRTSQGSAGVSARPARSARRWLSALLIISNLILLAGIGAHYTARASAATVATLDDSGPGSLRQAIADAAPGDTISFAVSGTITLTTGELVIDKDLALSGPGAASLAISGNRANISLASRVINNSAHLTISGLTIREGEGGVGGGGGILNQSTGTLDVSGSVFDTNRAWQGGAIYNSAGGQVTIADSTFHANSSSAPVDGNGGAIFNAAPGGVLTISGSEFDFNTNHDNGSAVYNQAGATIVNSTFVYNQAGTSAVHNAGTLAINNATITGNNGRKPGSGVAGEKGSSTTVQNSIIAGNTLQGNGDFADCDGPISSGGHNIVGYAAKCGWAAAAGDQIGTVDAPINPLLGVWQDNGGPTRTLLPQAGSPAIDAGDPAAPGGGGSACAPTDQRGVARPAFGGASATCDIGAAEVVGNPPPPPASVQASADGPTALGQPTSFTATGSDPSFSYTWDFGDSTPPAEGAQVAHTYAAAGAYVASVTASAGAALLSASVQVTVNNPTPALESLSPATIAAGGPDVTITVTGASFIAGATITVQGAPRATTVVGDGQLVAVLTGAELSRAGALDIAVVNPAPGGGASSALPLTITGVVAPKIGAVSPASAAPGATVTIAGAGLATASAVTFSGVPASSFAVLDDASIAAVVPAGALNGPIAVTTSGGAASSGAFTVLTVHQCSVTVSLPALASGQTYWVQLTAHASGLLSAKWTLPRAQSSQLLLYAGNPFAGMANPVSKGSIGKPIASQLTTSAAYAVAAPGAPPAGTYTVQFFNASKALEATTGTISYANDGAACPSAASTIIP